jgi:hypothetical protein
MPLAQLVGLASNMRLVLFLNLLYNALKYAQMVTLLLVPLDTQSLVVRVE